MREPEQLIYLIRDACWLAAADLKRKATQAAASPQARYHVCVAVWQELFGSRTSDKGKVKRMEKLMLAYPVVKEYVREKIFVGAPRNCMGVQYVVDVPGFRAHMRSLTISMRGWTESADGYLRETPGVNSQHPGVLSEEWMAWEEKAWEQGGGKSDPPKSKAKELKRRMRLPRGEVKVMKRREAYGGVETREKADMAEETVHYWFTRWIRKGQPVIQDVRDLVSRVLPLIPSWVVVGDRLEWQFDMTNHRGGSPGPDLIPFWVWELLRSWACDALRAAAMSMTEGRWLEAEQGLPGKRLQGFPQDPPVEVLDEASIAGNRKRAELLPEGEDPGAWPSLKPLGNKMVSTSSLASRDLMFANWLFILEKAPLYYTPAGEPVYGAAQTRGISCGQACFRTIERHLDRRASPGFDCIIHSDQSAWLKMRLGIQNLVHLNFHLLQGIAWGCRVMGASWDAPTAFPWLIMQGVLILLMEVGAPWADARDHHFLLINPFVPLRCKHLSFPSRTKRTIHGR